MLRKPERELHRAVRVRAGPEMVAAPANRERTQVSSICGPTLLYWYLLQYECLLYPDLSQNIHTILRTSTIFCV